MDALSGVRRVWSGARPSPESRATPSTAPRLLAVGGRIGLVVPRRGAPSPDGAPAPDLDVADTDV
ncbi:hypothetical protein PEM37_18095 [Streptomyces sp. AD681]|uniref:hypothetical protein n=1 Tax=Streptomyces sp. AD681 TaxID=3019069 RepID=UPI0022F171EC|nr:hypothetical protein [Streptomyces sp. AD681]MDA5143427.1 hypothetical protein [Streptomyces sp. AD681]